jgi:hypothetical protein
MTQTRWYEQLPMPAHEIGLMENSIARRSFGGHLFHSP